MFSLGVSKESGELQARTENNRVAELMQMLSENSST